MDIHFQYVHAQTHTHTHTHAQELLPVNWDKFEKRNAKQPIKIIASGLFSEKAVMLGSQEGSFSDLASLCECIKASCMLPGVAGMFGFVFYGVLMVLVGEFSVDCLRGSS